jgi:hypothetical protein
MPIAKRTLNLGPLKYYKTTIRDMKSSTVYSYIHYFHFFWKWLYENFSDIVSIFPPIKRPTSFDEIKCYPCCPIDFDKITSKIFFNFVKTSKTANHKSLAYKVRCALRYIA